MKIVTWNINGLRTFKGVLKETIDSFNADVLCFQETKTNRGTLEADQACIDGYNSYFAFSRLQVGYSGVATYTSDDLRPFAVNELLQPCDDDGIPDMDKLQNVGNPLEGDGCFITPKDITNVDSEGRTLTTLYKFCDSSGTLKSLVIFNLYCPRNDPDRPERAIFKYNFNAMLEHQAKSLISKGYHVILAGDMNISHKRIDNCDPDEDFESSKSRIWMDKLLDVNEGIHFVDMFRHFHPNEKAQYTCWNSQKSARLTNFGTRIDYILADSELAKYFQSCDIHPDIMGSDHCPVSAILNVEVVSAEKILKKCTKFWPEFTGKQVTLKSFFTQGKPAIDPKYHCVKQKRTVATQKKVSSFFNSKKPKSDEMDQVNGKSSPISSFDSSSMSAEQQRDRDTGEMKDTPESTRKRELKSSWKNILKGPPTAPHCSGHNEACVMRIVKKEGPNKGKRFFCCARPDGAAENKEARCQFFVWI